MYYMRVCTYNKKLEMIGAIIDETSVTIRGVGKHLASFVPHCNIDKKKKKREREFYFIKYIKDLLSFNEFQ